MSIYSAPTLSYVGSIEPTNVIGANLFEIVFDSSLNTPFMFEYLIQQDASSGLPPSETTPTNIVVQDFIYPESAQTTGIANQWILPVPFAPVQQTAATTRIPFPLNGLPYNPQQTIRVRVYPENMVPTPWSNTRSLYNPPKQPTIVAATYAPSNTTTDLNIAINQITADPSAVQYIAAYYYKSNTSGSTVWAVTNPVTATSTTVGSTPCWLAKFPSILNYPDISGNNLYVSVNGVFPIPNTTPQSYTVSQISSTIVATVVSPSAPTLTDISYNVYVPNPVNPSNSGQQSMTLTWLPPGGTGTSYSITQYNIYRKYNNGSYGSPIATVGSGTLTYTDASLNITTSGTYTYQVEAIINNSPYLSNERSKNIFTYAFNPTVSVKWCTFANGTSQMETNFTLQLVQPYNPGINAGISNTITWQIYSNYATPLSSGYTVEQSGTVNYSDASGGAIQDIIAINNYTPGRIYGVIAWVTTTDTNNGGVSRNGLIANRRATPVPVPYIYDASYNASNNRITFNVVSGVPLNPDQTSTFIPSNSSGIMAVNWSNTIPTTLGQTVVYTDSLGYATTSFTSTQLPVVGDVVYRYFVSINNINRPLSNWELMASNSTGTGKFIFIPTDGDQRHDDY